MMESVDSLSVFFFNDTATTEIYTLSLHDALPICRELHAALDVLDLGQGGLHPNARADLDRRGEPDAVQAVVDLRRDALDRKSTRLNSSHANISYAVFCLKKKKSK